MAKTADLLARARQEAGLTQRALAVAADVPQASVSRIERGLISPRSSTIERWLDACGMTLRTERVLVAREAPQAPAETEPTQTIDQAPEVVEESRPDRFDWAPWMS